MVPRSSPFFSIFVLLKVIVGYFSASRKYEERRSGVSLGLLRQGPARFACLARTIPGISERMLSDRLNELARAGLVDRTVLDGPPLGVVYRLTESGRAIGPGLLRLGEWAERYMTPPAKRRKKA